MCVCVCVCVSVCVCGGRGGGGGGDNMHHWSHPVQTGNENKVESYNFAKAEVASEGGGE